MTKTAKELKEAIKARADAYVFIYDEMKSSLGQVKLRGYSAGAYINSGDRKAENI